MYEVPESNQIVSPLCGFIAAAAICPIRGNMQAMQHLLALAPQTHTSPPSFHLCTYMIYTASF